MSLMGWDMHGPPWVTGDCVGSDSDSPDGDYVFPGDLPQSLSQYLEQEIDLEVRALPPFLHSYFFIYIHKKTFLTLLAMFLGSFLS